MTTQEVANRYYELAQKGGNEQIIQELYSPNIVSIEQEDYPQLPYKVEGLEAYKQKEVQFFQMFEGVHSGYCNEPIVITSFFACAMGMDVTVKGQGRKMKHEIGVFEVNNGKIVKEQWFYKDAD
jgi:hypothetical protein